MINFFVPKEPQLDAPKKAPSFRSYVDPTHELDSQELAHDIWFIRHEVLLYKLLFWTTVLVAVLSWGYTIVKLGDYVIFGIANDNKLAQESTRFINYTPLKAKYSPVPLDNARIYFLQSGTNKSDAVVEINNPNDRWLASFTYRFNVGLVSSTEYQATIIPGQTTLLTTLGLDSSASDPTLQITNQRWLRVSNHAVPDMTKFISEHLTFTISNFIFTPASTDTNVASAGRIAFTYTNTTPFSYSHPSFLVGLYRNNALVGVIPLKIEEFRSQEKKEIDVRSFTPNLNVDSVIVYPLFNIFDSESYIAPAL